MAAIPISIGILLVAVAVGFAALPVFRDPDQTRGARTVLAIIVGLVTVGIGSGVYLMLGAPYLAQRSVAPGDDLKSLVAQLSVRVRQSPGDPRGWMLLGKGYLTLGDPNDAAAAFGRAIPLAAPEQRSELFSAQGEALTMAADGVVTPQAEEAFDEALRLNPKDQASRYYLGMALAMRGEDARALALWQSLLADAPPGAAWRGELVDRIAALRARTSGAPNVGEMVAGLAARLHKNPNDPQGWQRLIRAYAVLGLNAQAQAALADARSATRGDPRAQAALAAEAEALKLEK